MKIYNDYSLHNVLKNTENKKSISESDLENLRTNITNIYNSAISIGTLSKEQTTNIIYQIETGGKVKNFVPSMIDKECIQSMIDIHNKVDNKSLKIKEYTIILNHIEKDEYKNNSKTRDSKYENWIKEELINEVNDLENKIITANLVLNYVLNQHKSYFNSLMSKLEYLNTKESFEDVKIEFNGLQSDLSKLIEFKKTEYLDKKDSSKIKEYLDKIKEHDKKLDDIIKVLKDITSMYNNPDKKTETNTPLTSENILKIIKNHINKIKEINSKNI